MVLTIARRNGIALEGADDAERFCAAQRAKRSFRDLQEFLDLYYASCDVLRTEQDFFDICAAYLARAHTAGVVRAEIFYGVRSLEDPMLLARLARDGIPLTVCPCSNHRLQVNRRFFGGENPTRQLLSKGLKVTLNSDDPAYFFGHTDKYGTTHGDRPCRHQEFGSQTLVVPHRRIRRFVLPRDRARVRPHRGRVRPPRAQFARGDLRRARRKGRARGEAPRLLRGLLRVIGWTYCFVHNILSHTYN